MSRWIFWDIEFDDNDWGLSFELIECEVGRLICYFCVCCYYYGSFYCILDVFLGRFFYYIIVN